MDGASCCAVARLVILPTPEKKSAEANRNNQSNYRHVDIGKEFAIILKMYFDVYYSKTIDERDKRKVMSPSKPIKNQTSTANTSSNQPSYELSVQELEKLIGDMESGKLSLEETLIAYQRGTELIKKCQVLLEQVEQQIRIFEAE